MMLKYDLSDMRFGRLVAKHFGPGRNGRTFWHCDCDCGKRTEVTSQKLRLGLVKSCGCLRSEKMAIGMSLRHGMCFTRTYSSWDSMKERCTNPNHPSWGNYGGKGVTFCERWLDFKNFLADMGERPESMTLDRYPNKAGNYEPGNCRWASPKEQANNTSTNRKITYLGREWTTRELSEHTGVPYHLLRGRLFKQGWPAEDAVTKPVRQKYKRQ